MWIDDSQIGTSALASNQELQFPTGYLPQGDLSYFKFTVLTLDPKRAHLSQNHTP